MIKYLLLMIVSAFSLLIVLAHAENEKVALLFLTIKDINQSDLWEKQLKDKSYYSVYIHSTQELENQYFSSYRIENIVPTSWLYHTEGWIELLKEALKDPANKKFVFLSESCVPIWPLDTIYQQLVADNNSYMGFRRPWWLRDSIREVVELPHAHRWGNWEWVILNRKHAQLVLDDQVIRPLVALHEVEIESYFSSLFSYENCLYKEMINREPTYANWERGGAHPYTFREVNLLTKKYLRTAKEQGAFFARKFDKKFPPEEIESFIYSP